MTLVTQPDQRATVRQFPPRFPMHKFWGRIARNCHLAESSSQSVKNGCPWQKIRPRASHVHFTWEWILWVSCQIKKIKIVYGPRIERNRQQWRSLRNQTRERPFGNFHPDFQCTNSGSGSREIAIWRNRLLKASKMVAPDKNFVQNSHQSSNKRVNLRGKK